MFGRLLLLCFFFLQTPLFAQYHTVEKKLIQKIAQSNNDSDKVKALGNLAEFYYIYRDETKGDSVLTHQLLLAELSNDKKLILEALFGNALNYINNWTRIETFDKAIAFLNKGLHYAKELEKPEYEVLAYIRKAGILKKRGQYDNAIQQATHAFSSIDNIKNDSLKALLFLTVGDIYLGKGDAVSSYKNFNNAYDLAYSINNIPLQSEAFHYFSNLYQTLGNAEMAKANLYKSLELNKKYQNKQGLLQDYIDLARLTDEKEYIDKAILLADTLQSLQQRLFGKKLMFAYLIYVKKNSAQALDYFHNNDDLKQSYLNTGTSNYFWNIGNIYRYSGQPDSALYYYLLAEPEMQQIFDLSVRRTIYKEIGECYLLLNQPQKAITYFEQTLNLGREMKHLASVTGATLQLSKLYAQTGAYEKAYDYNRQYISLNDSLHKIVAQRDVVLLEVERETRKHEKDMENEAAKSIRTRNLQYIGISIVIATVFFFMMLLGMFPVSKFSIKMISFFAFICLFEFIVLLIDYYLHKLTHGEPLKIWLIKIFLIAMLVPLQHFLEHAVVRFLESRRLIRLREQFTVKRIMAYIKKPVPREVEVSFEKDTAVL